MAGVVCTGTPSGNVKVLDYNADSAGTVTRLAMDFGYRCNDIETRGSIRFGTDLPLRP